MPALRDRIFTSRSMRWRPESAGGRGRRSTRTRCLPGKRRAARDRAGSFPHSPREDMKISGVDIRAGNIIEYEGGIWRAVKIQHTQPGKGGAYMQVEMKNLIDGR